MVMEGSCLCGAVRYEITGAFKAVGNCHCLQCRKGNGAAFVTWGILDPQQFRWTAGTDALGMYETSPGCARCFCRNCGTPLASSHSGQVGEVAFATVDGDPGVRPTEHIFVGSKAPWHEITDQLPQHAEWPPGASA